MKVKDYTCNLCGESLNNLDELVGMNMGSKATFCPAPVESAKYHLCGCCLTALGEFAEKWKNKEINHKDIYNGKIKLFMWKYSLKF